MIMPLDDSNYTSLKCFFPFKWSNICLHYLGVLIPKKVADL